MLIGQSVIAPTAPGAVYYSPWWPRQGNAFTAVLEVINTSGEEPGTVGRVAQHARDDSSDCRRDEDRLRDRLPRAGAVQVHRDRHLCPAVDPLPLQPAAMASQLN